MGGAVSIRARTGSEHDFGTEFERLLGRIDARPRLVVDRDLHVLWQSENVGHLLHPPVPLRIVDGRLATDSDTASIGLTEFLEDAGCECSSLLLRGPSKKHWAMVMAWSPKDHPDAVCLLLNLSVPHRSVEQSGLARALRLTAAETRVLDRFARLNTPREIAEQMAISLSTVRSHLKQIHSKAGVESAVQLTQLVRGFCSC